MKAQILFAAVSFLISSTQFAGHCAAGLLEATLALNADHEPVVPGDTLIYTIDYVTGLDFVDAQQTIRIIVPPPARFLSASDGGTFANGIVEWDFEATPALERGQRTLSVQVDPKATAGSTFSVHFEGATADTYWWSATSHVQAKRFLELSVHGSPRWPNPENLVRYVITARNLTESTVHTVKLGIHFDQCIYPSTASWNLGDLESGASRSATYDMQFCGCVLNDAWLLPVTVEARCLESSYPARSQTVLWLNSFEDSQVSLSVTGIGVRVDHRQLNRFGAV